MFSSSPLITIKEVCELLHITGTTLRRWRALGIFPPPLPLGHRCLWRKEDIQKHITTRQEAALADEN
jgi:predicted DNA-binding transcriptional regulator AlpA